MTRTCPPGLLTGALRILDGRRRDGGADRYGCRERRECGDESGPCAVAHGVDHAVLIGHRAGRLDPSPRVARTGNQADSRATIPRMQEYVISELDSGERLITERLDHVRSVVARVLDRSGLAGRARLEGRRHALHRAPALQGHALVLGPGDRRDLRRDGRRAERRHVARVDGRVRARPGPPSRARPRRDGGHGLRADVRRRRRRARGRARGDRDGGGHAAGSRPRPPRRGRLRQPRARAGR